MSEAKHPDVYTKPIQYKPDAKPGQLNEDQLKQFYDDGYVIIEDFIDKDLLEKAKDAIGNVSSEIIEDLFNAGKISSRYEDESFCTRMIKVNKEFPGASVLFHKRGVLPKELQEIWSYPKLLHIVEQLVGPNIIGHTVWNLRVKLPNNEPEVVPWHQDNGYLLESSLETMMPTRWSLDFRWQDPYKPTGRPEKSDNLPLMMTTGTVIENIDFSGIQGRHGSHKKNDVKEASGKDFKEDDFDTRIAGPWMKRWTIKHHNKHTSLAEEQLSGDGKITGWHSP